MESSDAMISIEPADSGGIVIELESSVKGSLVGRLKNQQYCFGIGHQKR